MICALILISVIPWALITCSQDLQSITLSPLNPVLGPNGMATAVNPGTTTVTASYGLVTGVTTLNVGMTMTTGLTISVTAPGNPTGSLTPTIPTGLYQQFTATATYPPPDNTIQDVTSMVSWTSSDPTKATINPISGLATGVAAGITTIIATYGSVPSVPVTLTVSGATPNSIAVTAPGNPTSISSPVIPNGLNQQFAATAAFQLTGPGFNTSYDVTYTMNWTTNNTLVATINPVGLATTVGSGTTAIIATYPPGTALTSTLNLTVINAAINSISVTAPGNPANVLIPVIPKGLTQQLAATGTFSDGHNYDITPYVYWSSRSPLQVFVNSTGLATASGAAGNSSLITAAYNGNLGSSAGNITLAISPATLETITVLPANPRILNGLSQKFIATGLFSDGSRSDISTMVSWTLAAATPPIATISNSYYQQMTATGNYNGGSGNISSMVTWTSDDLTVAFVNPYGMVSAVGPGTTTINAAYQGVSTGTSVTVFTPILSFIRITPQNPFISIPSTSTTGTNLQFTATGYYSDGTNRDVTGIVTWSSLDSSKALFNSTTTGLMTAVAPGTTVITATAGSISANTTLVVN